MKRFERSGKHKADSYESKMERRRREQNKISPKAQAEMDGISVAVMILKL